MFRRILKGWAGKLLVLLVISGAGLILFLATLRFGLVYGEEFAPDTFERRAYWYYELPLVRLKITPVFRKVRREPLETNLVTKKLIASNPPPKRWDLVAAHRSGELWRKGDAQVLCHYLDAWDNENSSSYWDTWTADHPVLAKVIWPEIANLARRELYFLIPQVFETSLEHDKPQTLRNDLNLLLARKYDLLAADELELGNVETAVEFYTHALKHQPGRASSLQGRAACYTKMGKTEEATRDQRAAGVKAEEAMTKSQ